MELKKQVVRGVVWTMVDRGGSMAVQTLVSILLARLLAPSAFGLISMLTVFSLVSNVFVEGGFTQALIRKERPTPRDYTSVFWLNVAMGLFMYLLLCALAWPIARFYDQPELVRIAPLLFLTLPVSSLWITHQTVLTKRFDFRVIAKISIVSFIVSGGAAVWMAFAGWGAWALAWQAVLMNATKAVLFWCWNRWRPTAGFSVESLRELFGASSRFFLTELINQTFHNVSQMLVARFYSVTQTGYYSQSRRLKDLPSASLSVAIMNVTFPALSALQNDREKLREGSRKVIAVMAFLLYPVMVGMLVTAPELFAVVLTDKWMPAVPYFQIFCLTTLTLPLTNVLQNVLKVCGRTQLILNIEIVRKAFAALVIAVTLPVSVQAVIWGQLLYMTVDMAINMYYASRLVEYRMTMQLRDLAPVALLTFAMWAGVTAVGMLAAPVLTLGWLLTVKITAGAAIYLGGARLFRLAAWNETYEIVRGLLGR